MTLRKQDYINVGVSLGLDYDKLSDVSADEIHLTMISWWLKKQDYVMTLTGTPTLRTLISALRENRLNGNAEEIEIDNPMTSTSESCKFI